MESRPQGEVVEMPVKPPRRAIGRTVPVPVPSVSMPNAFELLMKPREVNSSFEPLSML